MNSVKNKRNTVLDWVKLALACLVVMIHISLPGMLGTLVNCFARIAVPTFFIISGYYAYGANTDTLRRRAWHIAKLMLFAAVIYYAWNAFVFVRDGSGSAGAFLLSECSLENLFLLLVFQYNWYLEPLWYLLALILCYAVLWLYVRSAADADGKTCYRPLYYAAAGLLLAHFFCAAAVAVPIAAIPNHIYRNGWFFGIPMFTFGLFLREYGEVIIARFRLSQWKLAALFCAGAMLAALQWLRFGVAELPLGSLLQSVALILGVMRARPAHSARAAAFAATAGEASMVVYLLHWLVFRMLRDLHLLERLPFARAWAALWVIGICIVIGFLYGFAIQRQRKSE